MIVLGGVYPHPPLHAGRFDRKGETNIALWRPAFVHKTSMLRAVYATELMQHACIHDAGKTTSTHTQIHAHDPNSGEVQTTARPAPVRSQTSGAMTGR